MRPLVLVTWALCLLGLSCAPSSDVAAGGDAVRPTLRFTAIPDHETTELIARFEPFARWLSGELGVEVEYVPSTDYQASVEMFKTGDVRFAWFGGLTGAQACAAVPDARPIAMGRVDPEFKSYFVAHGSTGLQRSDAFPEGLRGRSFTFGSESSTSGRLMPEHFVRESTGQSPQEFFGMPNAYSGSHDRTAKLVEAGTFEAGALNYRTYDRMLEDGELDPERCRVVWVTPPYADYSWTAHPGIDETFGEGTIDRLQDALVRLEDPDLLRAVDRPDGLVAADADDFAGIVDLAARLGFL